MAAGAMGCAHAALTSWFWPAAMAVEASASRRQQQQRSRRARAVVLQRRLLLRPRASCCPRCSTTARGLVCGRSGGEAMTTMAAAAR